MTKIRIFKKKQKIVSFFYFQVGAKIFWIKITIQAEYWKLSEK